MGHTLRIVCVASLLPALVLAQRPGMGGLGRGKIGTIQRAPGIEIPKTVNPINLMIEHRKDLALSDTQFMKVIAIKRVLDSTNAPLARRLDSVQRVFKTAPLFTDPSPQRRDSLAQAHIVVQGTVIDLEQNFADARDKAYALLSASQRVTAEQIEEKARKASEPPARGRS
jgi:hypothetical protein